MAQAISSTATRQPVVPNKGALAVSPFERVYSGMASMLLLALSLVMLLFLVWLGKQVSFTQTAVPVLPIIVDDETGGFEHGVLGENIEIPGPVTGELGYGGEKPEPKLQETLEMVNSVVSATAPQLVDPNLTQETKWSTGGVGGSRGTGNAPALGLGGGSGGGVRRAQRWVIDFEKGASPQEYARQLDFFKIELAVIGGSDQIQYAKNFLKATPEKRTGPGDKEERLYFSWRQGPLQDTDRDLLSRAGIQSGGKLMVQFYPPETENLLANVEMQYLNSKQPGRSIKTVRQTKFRVKPEGPGYTFMVTAQTYLGG